VSPIANHTRPAFLMCLLPVLLLLMSGCCKAGYRLHSEFEQRVTSIKHPALMPLDVKVFESLPGGMAVLREDWTTIGKKNLQNAVLKGFAQRNTAVRLLSSNGEMHAELAEIQSLYKVVNKSIRLQSYGRASTANGARKFEYSLGPLASTLLSVHLRKFPAINQWQSSIWQWPTRPEPSFGIPLTVCGTGMV